MAVRAPGSWVIKIVRSDTRDPAPGVPVTVLDAVGNATGHWVSDVAGLVKVPRTEDEHLRVRVGLRTEAPTVLDSVDLRAGATELLAPSNMLPELPTAAVPSPDLATEVAVSSTADVGVTAPAQLLRFHRVGMFAGEPSPGDAVSRNGDPAMAAGVAPADFFNVVVNYPAPIRYGVVLELVQRWQPLGYVLGGLLYSMPLAPGDEGRVALVDRRQAGNGGEDLTGGALLHDIARGVAAAGLADAMPENESSLPIDAFILSAAPDSSIIERVAADTAAFLNDRTDRASHMLRGRRAFAVREVDDDAAGSQGVRVLRNPHRDRTLTYQYFETLERYRVRSEIARVRPALLVPFRMPNLATPDAVRQYGYILRRVLLDPTLHGELDRMLGEGDTGQGAPRRVTELRLVSQVAPGEAALDLWQASLTLRVGAVRYQLRFAPANAQPERFADADVPRTAHWLGTVRPVDFERHPLLPTAAVSLENPTLTDLVFERLVVEGRIGDEWGRLQAFRDVILTGQSRLQLLAVPGDINAGRAESPLLAHVAANLPHYAAAIIAAGDPSLRFLALAKMLDARGRSVGDIVENTVVGVLGNYVAFPLRSISDLPRVFQPAFGASSVGATRPSDEVLLAVPTPGAWLKTVLGAPLSGVGAASSPAMLPPRPSRDRGELEAEGGLGTAYERDWEGPQDLTQAS